MHPRQAALLLLGTFLLVCASALAADPAKSASTKQHNSHDGYYQDDSSNRDKPRREGSYTDDKEYESSKDDCPSPQSPDQVKQVYLDHGTFEWATVAREMAKGERSASRFSGHKEPKKRRPHKPATPARKPAAAATSSIDSSTLVKTAAVTDPNFMLATSLDQTGVGFQGTSDIPVSDEAIAVAEHPDVPGAVLIVHAINSALEVFVATRDGKRLPSQIPTKIPTQAIFDALPNTLPYPAYLDSDPNLWYDAKEERWVLVLMSFVNSDADNFPVKPPLVVAVSQSRNPLATWSVWALDASVDIAPALPFCSRAAVTDFVVDYPQASYDDTFVHIAVGLYCGEDADATSDFLSVLFVYPKAALYALPPSSPTTAADIKAAVYLGPGAWYRSVPAGQQSIGAEGGYAPYNNFIQPARPQDPEDMSAPPMFVMKVNDEFMSVGTLTDGEISSVKSSPKLLVRVINKGADFSNTPGTPEAQPSMLQPNTNVVLDAGDVGMVTLTLPPVTSGIRSYWAMHHRGTLFMTTSEYFGAGTRDTRTPSVYWAILEPELPGLCRLRRKDWGVIASSEGLPTAYPVIAGTDKGAVLAYSYSGSGTISGGRYPAFPGVATTTVVCDNDDHDRDEDERPIINIVQRGPGAMPAEPPSTNRLTNSTRRALESEVIVKRWGDYSAAQVLNGQLWYVVPIPIPNEEVGFWRGSWISVLDL